MSVGKLIELSGQSAESFEDAIRQAVQRASTTIRNIRSVWAKEFEAVVENNQVTQFRVIVKIAFVLDEGADVGPGNLGEAQGLGLPRGEG
jgi:dodecin